MECSVPRSLQGTRGTIILGVAPKAVQDLHIQVAHKMRETREAFVTRLQKAPRLPTFSWPELSCVLQAPGKGAQEECRRRLQHPASRGFLAGNASAPYCERSALTVAILSRTDVGLTSLSSSSLTFSSYFSPLPVLSNGTFPVVSSCW